MQRFRSALGAGVLVASVAMTADGQGPPTVLRLADGREVHVMGLRRWTVGMIQDSLAKYSPGDSLQSHACAAVLRYKLGFADASATTLSMGGVRPDILFIGVREPQDSARVRYRNVPLDTLPAREGYRVATSLMTTQRAFDTGVRRFLRELHADASAIPAPTDTVGTTIVTFLRTATRPSDYRAALAVLAKSPNYRDRTIAALVLGNFTSRAPARLALMQTCLLYTSPSPRDS